MKYGYTIYKDGELWQDNAMSLIPDVIAENKEFRSRLIIYCHGPNGQGWYNGKVIPIDEEAVPVEIKMLHMLLGY